MNRNEGGNLGFAEIFEELRKLFNIFIVSSLRIIHEKNNIK